jgi:hypothetical protein
VIKQNAATSNRNQAKLVARGVTYN